MRNMHTARSSMRAIIFADFAAGSISLRHAPLVIGRKSSSQKTWAITTVRLIEDYEESAHFRASIADILMSPPIFTCDIRDA